MRSFRRNSSLQGSEATEIIRHRPQRQLKDSLDGPQWKASIRWRSGSARLGDDRAGGVHRGRRRSELTHRSRRRPGTATRRLLPRTPEPTSARATWVTCRSLPNSPCEPRGHLASARPRHASEVHRAANRVDLSCVLIAASTAPPLVDRVSWAPLQTLPAALPSPFKPLRPLRRHGVLTRGSARRLAPSAASFAANKLHSRQVVRDKERP